MIELPLANGTNRDPFILNYFAVRVLTGESVSLPDGTLNPTQLGTLSLGPYSNYHTPGNYMGPPIAQSSIGPLPVTTSNIDWVSVLIPSNIMAAGDIPTGSYGLHFGSAALELPLSLLIGGYDQSRLIGNVSEQPVTESFSLEIDLLDIGLSVESGRSPFATPPQQGLLAKGNSSIGASLPVVIDPLNPYLYLPRSTCEAIAAALPVTYQPSYDLYSWDTADARYAEIIKSPSSLSFTFRSTSAPSITIKVPFALLNLTLDTPFVNQPTSYFPCQPPNRTGSYTLGRAFLQAAFLAVDWDAPPRQWYLGQAPGLNTASEPTQMLFSANSTLTASSNIQWTDIWKGSWTPLGSSSSASSALPPSSTSSKPSTGAKAGIAVVVIAAFAAIASLLYIYHSPLISNL